MEELYFILLKTPMIVMAIIIGVICSVVGLVLYNRLPEQLRNEKMRILSIMGFVGILMALSMTNYPEYLKTKIAESLASYSNQNIFHAAVFDHHENARPIAIEVIKDLAEKSQSYDDLELVAQERIAHIAHDYLFGDMVIAEDKAVFEYMNHSLLIMETLKDRPATCKSYNEGEYQIISEALPKSLLQKETQIKASIIKMAANNPYPLDIVYDVNGFYEKLKALYASAGYNENDLLELENVSNLPPVQSCAQNIRFMSLLTSLGRTQGSIMFKNLMLSSN